MSSGASRLSLELLPDEILSLIVGYFSTTTLKDVACVSRTLNHHATDVLWRNVCLTDKWTLHLDHHSQQQLWGDRGHGESDEHDDSPIIEKLYLLATQPRLASKVQVLTHRCHLSPPNIFNELPRMHFDGPNLSQDERLISLLMAAIQNMANVHTLRIVYGHMNITNALVLGFLQASKGRQVPLRKLWLESCCLSWQTWSALSSIEVDLECVRLRRLEIQYRPGVIKRKMGALEFSLCRGGQYFQLHNGAGNFIATTIHLSEEGLPERWPRQDPLELTSKAKAFDAKFWQDHTQIRDYADRLPHLEFITQSSHNPAAPFPLLVNMSVNTLTSLNFDWILWRRNEQDPDDISHDLIKVLANMRFPHLRAFQMRNAVLLHTKLPENVYLLEGEWLSFIENHPKLQCLAWPIDRFYGDRRPSIETWRRAWYAVAHLATTLIDLRVDFQYAAHGEFLTDTSHVTVEAHARIRRKLFISTFASHMRKIQQIKLEGGLPRDEKREILRALHWCPLKKVVMIGVSFPVGNTWGLEGEKLKALDPGQSHDTIYNLEREEFPRDMAKYDRTLPPAFKQEEETFEFEPYYGWSAEPPFLHTIAEHHAETIEELKLCGYNGCPILFHQTRVTAPLLSSLRHFHNLKQIVISFWLLTWFEDSYRDTDIIQSWLNSRSPSSTALAVVTPPPQSPASEFVDTQGQYPHDNPATLPPRQDFNRWAVLLKTRYAPSALAYRVAQDIGPYISEIAKSQPGGVRVRGSFCLGAREEGRSANDIFDLDVRIGKDDQVLEFIGPREEGEKGRWWQKLEGRRWF